jgi:NAD-dependent dihydropyrimidine dehydrogenase PreA subunit
MKITDDCIACGMCVESCPQEAIKVNEEKKGGYAGYYIDKDLCVDCGACLDSDCPGNAIKEG